MILVFVATIVAAPFSRRQAPFGVPSYVFEYAPVVYLHSSDPYRPANVRSQLTNTQPEFNYTAMNVASSPLTLDYLNNLNNVGGPDVYLTSKDNIEDNPTWLNGITPDSNGRTNGATSCAIIVNDHGDGLVDVFYMYFYAYDQAGTYFGVNVGNHVGDWEHNMVRFKNGQSQAIWYSQHSNGQAFHYETVEKYNDGLRVSIDQLIRPLMSS